MAWTRPSLSAAGPQWKPKVCHDCRQRHPSFNRDGGKPGTPWRCRACDAVATALPDDQLPAMAPAAPAPPLDDRQGALL